MKGNKIVIFAGTVEGRRLAEFLSSHCIPVHVCVATEYGESLLPKGELITATHERMDQDQMTVFLKQNKPEMVIDATHPFAQEVTKNLKAACEKVDITYVRLLRKSCKETVTLCDTEAADAMVYVSDILQAVEYLKQTEGNIFVTTGSKELGEYTKLPNYKERVYARVLSTANVAAGCEALGFAGRHLICMQGPFSKEMNLAMLKEFQISYMVTKESGLAGGYQEKLDAAYEAGVKIIVIGRPVEEDGFAYGEVVELIKKHFSFETDRNIYLVGIGMGGLASFTKEALDICAKADALIGAERMLGAVEDALRKEKAFLNMRAKRTFSAYRADEITADILQHPENETIAVVLSGDPGFYSGAKKLTEKLSEVPNVKISIVPGISTVVYMAAKLGLSWDDMKLVSIHGRAENLLAAVRNHKKTFTLTGSVEDVRRIGHDLAECGMKNLMMHVGENLSYDTEKITTAPPVSFCEYQGAKLAAVIIEHPHGGEQPVTPGIPDDAFVRGKVPMTKKEVRSISLTKMKICRDDIIYDIGAGTGSVSVEAALQASEGWVYAIETHPEGNELIAINSNQFSCGNISIVNGMAPEALADLPAPDVIFIGGSKGHLKEILETVRAKNPAARVVINAISIETLAQTMEYCRVFSVEEEEIVQVQISKSRTIGAYHMMTGQNPIYIISFRFAE